MGLVEPELETTLGLVWGWELAQALEMATGVLLWVRAWALVWATEWVARLPL
jgi:hypothetical protein